MSNYKYNRLIKLLDEEGNLWGWGVNTNGELGNGTRTNLKSPEKIQTDVKLVHVSNQGYSTYIVKNDGKLYVTGSNQYGQLGLEGGKTYYYEFTHVPFFDDKEIVEITGGQYDVKILTDDGNVYVAGRNNYGQLGLGNITDVKIFGPKMVLPTGRKVTRIFGSYYSAFVELDDGQIWGCGENSSGALGFRSNYNVGGTSSYHKYLLTNPVTLEMVQEDGSTITIPPISESTKTSTEIYEGGNGRIIDLQTGYNVTIMIDASGNVRATGSYGKTSTSALYENNGGNYSFNKLVLKVDTKLKDPVIPEELEENLNTNYDLVHYVNNINLPNTEVLTEYRNRDKTETNYTYGLERVWGIQRVSSISLKEEYYIYDGRGSVSALASRVGNVVTQYRYDPFGVMTKNEATERSIYGYNGEEYNQAIESQYLRGRYYTPKAGRFFVEDSYQGNIVNPLSLNKYAYGLNNPLRYRDPSGHIAMDPGNDMNTYSPQTKIGYQQPTAQAPKGGTFKLTGNAGNVQTTWIKPEVYKPPSKTNTTITSNKNRQAMPADDGGYLARQKEIARVAEEKRKKVCEGLKAGNTDISVIRTHEDLLNDPLFQIFMRNHKYNSNDSVNYYDLKFYDEIMKQLANDTDFVKNGNYLFDWNIYTNDESPALMYAYGANGMPIIFQGIDQYIMNSLNNAYKNPNVYRPNNIKAGGFKKLIYNDKLKQEAFMKDASKAFKIAAYAGAAIDAVEGMANNIESGEPADKIISDMVVDVAVSGTSTYFVNIIAGAVAGGPAGAVAGFVLTGMAMAATDGFKVNDKSLRDVIKEQTYIMILENRKFKEEMKEMTDELLLFRD